MSWSRHYDPEWIEKMSEEVGGRAVLQQLCPLVQQYQTVVARVGSVVAGSNRGPVDKKRELGDWLFSGRVRWRTRADGSLSTV